MLNVSTAWHDQFNKNVINEELIKFVIEDYGTLYKEDIFSYSFSGCVSPISNTYPTYEARLELVMRNDYLDFSTFLGKSVEIYYGIKTTSEEYAKALTLFVDNIEISDDGRIAYFTLKSVFAYLTKTISIELYSIDNGNTITYTNTFRTFLSSQLTGHSYSESGTSNFKVRNFPSKITLGQALQELCFVNMRSLSLDKDGQIIIKDTDYGNVQYFNDLNYYTYPHIEKMDMPSDVVVDILELNNSDIAISNVCMGYMSITHQTQQIYYGNFTNYYDNYGAFITRKTISYLIEPYGTISDSFVVHNDHIEVSANGTTSTDYVYEIGGFSYSNYANTQDGKTIIFNVNIINFIHQLDLDAHITRYLKPQQTCEVRCRIDPSIELLDTITSNNGMKMTIEEMNIEFKGSFEATIKGRYDICMTDPVVQEVYTSTQSSEWYADIYNPNVSAMTLKVVSSQGTTTLTINSRSTLRLTYDNCPKMDGSMYAKDNGDLTQDVYCYFVNASSELSGNVIILEADE